MTLGEDYEYNIPMPDFIQNLDLSFMRCFSSWHLPVLVWLAGVVSYLAWKGLVFWILTGILWFKGKKKEAACLALALLLATGLTGILKGVVMRPRPGLYAMKQIDKNFPELLTTAHSFPSGHTTLAAAGSYVISTAFGGWSAWLSILFVVLVAAARVFQGMHWMSDVVGSMILGVISGYLAVKLANLPLISKFTDLHK